MGIRSSVPQRTRVSALGYGEASAIFSNFPAVFVGQSVDDTSVTVRYTRYGDATLDGLVNLTDFNRLASNFGPMPGRCRSTIRLHVRRDRQSCRLQPPRQRLLGLARVPMEWSILPIGPPSQRLCRSRLRQVLPSGHAACGLRGQGAGRVQQQGESSSSGPYLVERRGRREAEHRERVSAHARSRTALYASRIAARSTSGSGSSSATGVPFHACAISATSAPWRSAAACTHAPFATCSASSGTTTVWPDRSATMRR